MTTEIMTCLGAALDYAARGWRVAPLHDVATGSCSCGKSTCGDSAGKHPRIKEWQRLATWEPNDLKHWWRAWPQAGVCVVMGQESGVWALDADGEEGIAQLAALELSHGELPRTPTFSTGGGGVQLLFSWPADGSAVTSGAKIEKRPIDTRGRGGQSVMPPSVSGKGSYRWLTGLSPSEVEPAAAPPWLLAWLRVNGRLQGGPAADGNGKHAPRPAPAAAGGQWTAERRAIAYLERCPPGIQGQRGSDPTYAAARAVVYGFDLGVEKGLHLLLEHYNARCMPPWSEKELLHKCQDADRKEFGKPRGYLLNAERAGGNGHSNGHTPAQTASAPTEEDGDGWEPPIPLDDDAGKVEPFPLDVFPRPYADYFQGLAEAMNCPVDYPACFGLAALAGAIGAAYAVDIKEGYPVPLHLYLCVVAPKGSGKTPAFLALVRPFHEEQARRRQGRDDRPAFVSDVTAEKVADLLQDNQKGFPVARDELSGWMLGMNQYKARGSGSDRSFWLEVNSGSAVSVHRKDPSRPPVFVPHPCVPVFGGIQPPVLARLKGPDDDGWFDRFLFSFPEPMPARRETWATAPAEGRLLWERTILQLIRTPMRADDEGNQRPFFLKMSQGARLAWEDWTGWVADRRNDPAFPRHLEGPVIKMEGFAARMAGTLHVLREIHDGNTALDLERFDMECGARLGKYFLSHARKVYSAMGRDPRIADAQKVLAWVRRNGQPSFTRRSAWRALKHNIEFAQPEDLSPPLKLLTAHGFIRWMEQEYAGTGRKPAPAYEVNPCLLP